MCVHEESCLITGGGFQIVLTKPSAWSLAKMWLSLPEERDRAKTQKHQWGFPPPLSLCYSGEGSGISTHIIMCFIPLEITGSLEPSWEAGGGGGKGTDHIEVGELGACILWGVFQSVGPSYWWHTESGSLQARAPSSTAARGCQPIRFNPGTGGVC